MAISLAKKKKKVSENFKMKKVSGQQPP